MSSVRQVDVLSRAVEISADGPGLQKFAPHFRHTWRRTEESFALGHFSGTERRNRVSPAFLRGRSARLGHDTRNPGN